MDFNWTRCCLRWIWLFLACLPLHAWAGVPYPDLSFERYENPDGPFGQSFTNLHVDRDGFLWVAAMDTVYRFDGHNFRQWPLAGARGANFSEDLSGRLWVLSEQAIWQFDRERTVRYEIPLPQIPHEFGAALAHGHRGTWLLTTDGQIFEYDERQRRFASRWKPPKPLVNLVSFRGGGERLWWLSTSELWTFLPEEDDVPRVVERFPFVPILTADPIAVATPVGDSACMALRSEVHCSSKDGRVQTNYPSASSCNAITHDAKGTVYATCGDSLLALEPTAGSSLTIRAKLPFIARFSRRMQVDANGMVWITADHHIGIIDPTTGVYQEVVASSIGNDSHALPGPLSITNRLMPDGRGLWIAANGQGLFRARLQASAFEHWKPPSVDDGQAPLIRTVLEDSPPYRHQLWVTDANTTTWRIPIEPSGHLGIGVAVKVPSSIFDECRALLRTADGTLLLSTRDQLLAYRDTRESFEPVDVQWPDGAPMEFCGLHQDSRRRIWAYGSFGFALLSRDRRGSYRATVYRMPSLSIHDLFDPLYEDSKGLLWSPTQYGIRLIDPDTHRTRVIARPDVPLAAEWVHQIVEQPSGQYWIATRGGGLQRLDLRNGGSIFDPKRWHSEQPPVDSSSAIRYAMLKDSTGHLWLSGTRGIDRFDPSQRRWQHFGRASGLQQLDFNHGVATRLSDGRLVFGGMNGLTLVNPASPELERKTPRILWQGIQMAGGDLLPTERLLDLPYDLSAFTVHYLALDYDAPNSLRYRYRLHREDKWTEVGDQRRLHFAGLDSGSYRLEVQAAYNDGAWSSDSIVMPIRIASPWYVSRIAILVYAASAFALFMLYRANRNAQQRMLEQIVAIKTQELTAKTEALAASNVQHAKNNELLRDSQLELLSQKDELKRLLDAREKFFQMFSHEFRTPMTVISMQLEHALSDAGRTRSALPTRLLSIQRNARRIIGLIETLLDKKRLEDRAGSPLVRIDVAHEARRIVDDFLPIAAHRHQTLAFDCRLEPGARAVLREDCLQIILNNLLSNALKYTPESGRIDAVVRQSQETLVIQVADNGIGIDPADKMRVFLPYFRTKSAANSDIPGQGYGLHLVMDEVARHDGEIDLESTPGVGTVFTVRLPAQMSHGAELPSQMAAEISANTHSSHDSHTFSSDMDDTELRMKTLLIIEDEPEIREILAETLADAYRCVVACDGATAIALVAEESPDLILCDVGLPDMSGFEVCSRLKSDMHTAHIPVVFLTAYSSDESKLQGLRAFGDDYIVKPPSMDELRLRIDNRLRTRDALLARTFSGAGMTPSASPDVTTKDENAVAAAIDFRTKLDAILGRHYTNPDFSVSALASAICCSPRTLQRRMEQYALGATPLEFIRNYRLDKAAALLRAGRRIGEAAEACGLDPRTFSDAFRTRFGMTPSEWKKRH